MTITPTHKRVNPDSYELPPNKILKTDHFKLDELPNEIKVKILSILDIPDIINTSLVNNNWSVLSYQNFVWKQIAKKIGCPTEIQTQPQQVRVKNYIEGLRRMVSSIRNNEFKPFIKDIEAILSKKLTIEKGIFLNQFVNSWSRFVTFFALADHIQDKNTCDLLISEKTSAQIIEQAEKFSAWFTMNKTSMPNIGQFVIEKEQLKEIPSEIFQLTTEVSSLHFGENCIETIPSEIGKLTNLTHIFLTENRITTIPTEFFKLTNLTNLCF